MGSGSLPLQTDLDERVELLVSADGELQMAGRDTLDLQSGEGGAGKGGVSERYRRRLPPSNEKKGGRVTAPGAPGAPCALSSRRLCAHLEVLGGVTGELQHLGGEVLCRGRREEEKGSSIQIPSGFIGAESPPVRGNTPKGGVQ